LLHYIQCLLSVIALLDMVSLAGKQLRHLTAQFAVVVNEQQMKSLFLHGPMPTAVLNKAGLHDPQKLHNASYRISNGKAHAMQS
jgi:hypothetical protein